MSDPRSITADAFEILVVRELRRAGLEPVNLHRRSGMPSSGAQGYTFDMSGRLQAYQKRWSVLVECRNRSEPLQGADLDALRARADASPATSALLFTTTDVGADALVAARKHSIPVLRVVDAQSMLVAQGVIQPGQLPAWVPEFTVAIVTAEGMQLTEPDQPELVLRELRAR